MIYALVNVAGGSESVRDECGPFAGPIRGGRREPIPQGERDGKFADSRN